MVICSSASRGAREYGQFLLRKTSPYSPLKMPGDFSVCVCLSPPPQPQFHCSDSGSLRPCLVPSCRPIDTRKKNVVFADALGLSLTSVRHFTRAFFDEEPLVLALASLRALRPLSSPTYTLDFSPPTQDYSRYREKLEEKMVCLEQCAVQGGVVGGTVRVRNIGFEKRVTLRVSFNGWLNHYDLPCTYLRDPRGGGDTDSFSFRMPLQVDTVRAEFCFCYWCAGEEYWDNHDGKNYCLHKEGRGKGYLQGPYW